MMFVPSLSFRGFRKRGKNNPHGWGVAFYPDESVQIIKEPLESGKSSLSNFLKDYSGINTKLLIGHVRRASEGLKSHKNTHPFSRELIGKEYVFAHNGTLRGNYRRLKTGRFKPVGETDSELAFCHIMYSVTNSNISLTDNDSFVYLTNLIHKINSFGDFNCIFSDGEHLFCYHDQNGYNGLKIIRREAPFSSVRLADDDFRINLNEEKDPEQKGFVISTTPLTNENWESFDAGELIVFKNGEMQFSSNNRRYTSSDSYLEEDELRILRFIKESPHKVSIGRISKGIGVDIDLTKTGIRRLRNKNLIRQDRRDKVGWNNSNANYFTESSKREEINSLLN